MVDDKIDRPSLEQQRIRQLSPYGQVPAAVAGRCSARATSRHSGQAACIGAHPAPKANDSKHAAYQKHGRAVASDIMAERRQIHGTVESEEGQPVGDTEDKMSAILDEGGVNIVNGGVEDNKPPCEEQLLVSNDIVTNVFSPKKSSKINSVELLLNEKNTDSCKSKAKNNIYTNPIDSAESVSLLKKTLIINTKEDAEDEKRVQFNNSYSSIIKIGVPGTPTSICPSETSSTSSSSSSSSLDISEARPPDGGWGWVVVLASFIVNLIADGITFSFGVIFVEFLDYFGENRGTTAWIGSLFMAMPLLSGPIASFLTDRYGCRRVTIFGAILSSVGFIISSQANSMFVLCITFGMLAGFGLSLCYVASVVIVAYYFDKKRSFAIGLSVCGSGIGTFIFAPLIQLLLDEYGWRGTTLILAGLFLNLVVCGALMRDLPWTSKKQKSLAKERKRNRHLKRKIKGSSADSFSVSNSTNTASVLQPIVEVKEEDMEDLPEDRLCTSLVNLPTYVKNGEKVPVEVLELLSTHKKVYNVLLANYPSLLTPSRSFSDSGRLNETFTLAKHAATQSHLSPPVTSEMLPSPNIANQTENTNNISLMKNTQVNPHKVHHRKAPPAYFRDIRVHRLSVTYRGAMLNINRYRLRASSCPDIYRNSMTTIAKEKGQWYAGLWDFWDLIVDMFDFSHFADPKYLVFSLSNFLLYTWYDVPYVYLTDFSIKNGMSDQDASILISIIGIVNMVGEIILGWAGDRQWANASIIYAVCMVFCGGVIAWIPLLTNYWLLLIASGGFGFLIAANYSLTCIILVELITIERFTNAYGLLLLVQGIANLIGPPLAGWLYDITGKYDLPFYLAGLFIAISGLMLVVIPFTNLYRKFIKKSSQSIGEPSKDQNLYAKEDNVKV